MLNILLVSFGGAFVCTFLAVVLPGIANTDRDLRIRIKYGIFTFLTEMIYMILFLYIGSYPQTIWSVIMWIFPPLIISAIIAWMFKGKAEMDINMALAVVSILFCLSKLIAPVQEITYINGMENVVAPHAMSANEVSAKIELEMGEKEALRRIRKAYPTIILGEHEFDVDDDWNPYEIYVYREKFYTSNGKDYGIIALNLKDGNVKKYPAVEKNTPKWIDFKSTEPK